MLHDTTKPTVTHYHTPNLLLTNCSTPNRQLWGSRPGVLVLEEISFQPHKKTSS